MRVIFHLVFTAIANAAFVNLESEYNPENGPRPAQRGRSLTGSQVRRHYRLQGVVPVRQEDSAEEDYPFSLSSDGL